MNFLSKKSNESKFWNWFKKNSRDYYLLKKNQPQLFNRLKSELNKIHPYLVFEISSIRHDKKRELVISADGAKEVFQIVENLVSTSPTMDHWDIIPFRQPKKDIDKINYGSIQIELSSVFFRFKNDNRKIALELHIDGYEGTLEWTNATFILLDNLIGEYETEMNIGTIERFPLEESIKEQLRPISDLTEVVKRHKLKETN